MGKLLDEDSIGVAEYQADFEAAGIKLDLACAGEFKASLTRADLGGMPLICARERLPRVAHLRLGPDRACITLPLDGCRTLFWAGRQLDPDDVVVHRPQEKTYQRTTGACSWAVISLTARELAEVSSRAGRQPLPSCARIIKVERARAARLHRLLRSTEKAGSPPRRDAPTTASDILMALTRCMESGEAAAETNASLARARAMAQFEGFIACDPALPVKMPELCAAMGVSQRTFRLYCAQLLGMSPARYLRLRRMTAVNIALRDPEHAQCSVASTVRRFGFSELGRFAATYRSHFGESPSVTRRRASLPRE